MRWRAAGSERVAALRALDASGDELVEREYKGPARVIGVSGAGKTALLVHRANHLATKYPGERILVISLNAALCRLISQLLDALCSPAVRPRIEVQTVYDYCHQTVRTIDPGRLIEKYDPKSGEDLPACWRDFMKKPHALDNIQPLLSALENRAAYVDGRAYVLEELIWIRSGFGREERNRYLTCDRQGRGIPLPRFDLQATGKPSPETSGGMPADARRRLLQLLADYEEYMHVGGLADSDGVSLEAFSVRHRIKDYPSLRARSVLVDEVQDCSTVELAVVAEIPASALDGLYLTGDPIQKVFPKQHDLVQAGIDIKGRAAILRRNYRNSRQILEPIFPRCPAPGPRLQLQQLKVPT
jgi:superfamily I DNA/RNA helicase